MGRPLHVLRLCSVFEPPPAVLTGRGRRFDPIGGMQNHTACLTRALDRRGVVQDVVTTRPPGAPAHQALGRAAHVHRLGLPVAPLRQLYAPFAAARVRSLLDRADLVHAHLGEDLAVVPIALAAARRHHLPLVLTVHLSLAHTFVADGPRRRVLSTVGARIERAGVRRADAVLALTPRLAGLVVADGVDPLRVHVIPSGVEPARFAPRAGDGLAGIQRPRIGYVGRLCHQKGVVTLVDAFARVRHPGAQLVVVGDGPQRHAVLRRIAEHGLQDRVHLLGLRHHDEIPALLAALDVLVLPSVYEELGSVLLEALQAGLPIVASRTGGIPYALGDAGVLVAPGDAPAFAAAVDGLLRDDAARSGLAAAARARAGAFNWAHLATQVHDVYDAVLGRVPAPVTPITAPRAPAETA